MKKQKIISYFVVAAFFWLLFPMGVQAMSVSVDFPKEPLHVGDTALLKVVVNTDGKEINVVEGAVKFGNPNDIVSITTGGSIFKLWTRKPSLEGSKILFTGGTPSGVFSNSLQLFTIAVKPKSAKPIKINFENIAAYLNDGKGTKVSLSGSPVEIPVLSAGEGKDQLASLVTSDENPPLEFQIELGRDPSLYDGKYFISFYATDNESGIDMYMVSEDGYPEVRSGSVYVLQDQTLSGTVEVKAIDNAGNTRTQALKLKAGTSWLRIITIIILVFVVILAIYFVAAKIFRKKR